MFASCVYFHMTDCESERTTHDVLLVHVGWEWQSREGQKMINKVTSTLQVDYRLQCMMECRLSPICDSYNYRPSDKTCELNQHDTPLIANSADIVADSAWTWWSPIFCTVTV